MKKLFILGLIVLSFSASAQDPEFTQFYANPLYLNPAFAGTAKGARFSMNYRNQWASLNTPFVTYAVSYDQHFDALGGGIGAQVLYDVAGDGRLSTSMASLAYSYHLNLTPKFTVKASLQTAVQGKRIDFSELVFPDMIHPRQGVIYETIENLPAPGDYAMDPFLDFSAGVLAFSKKFYAGFVVNHINEPKQTFLEDNSSILPMKFTTHVGMQIPLDQSRHPTRFFSPNLLIQKQANFLQINLGAYYIKDYFLAGIWWRQTSVNTDAAMILVGMKRDPFKIGYSYDITFSDVRFGGQGSHELSIIVEIPTKSPAQTTKWRKLTCPDF
ncbi:MAG: type IX secretion system membrane protein PorP/SprF [Bacteroidetes bacterium]|jgi:type IX secretion system PorP/SprF family membrane protein|nr:type IX secretion system membrane protein PorP/SprF [Bacteroidota bacterium]MBT5528946.1 type IX secretion system membrane protein PorP/SprF [Cytophagia bacterium]MBT3422667.1 type IX secretion system membrane protein PorP/SprF [Bacteroidota bacterium]MBT3800557.1 type IX secretion system membrane protein PorP/SprF [Bacteroidota bacterium]MBT4337804.1 type IX secretion system membrane protein PorP/SprF [Bacteroidota bacterium]